MSESRNWFIYKIIVLYCFLASARACMTFGDNPYIDLGLAVLAFAIVPKYYFIELPNRVIAAFFLGISAMYTMLGGNVTGYLGQLGMVFLPMQLIVLDREYQIDLFRWLTKCFAGLLIVSLVLWCLWLLDVPLPHSSQKLSWEYDNYGYYRQNFYLFQNYIAINKWRTLESVFRFQGFFLEPGHMGTITTLFLFTNRYNLKRWYNIVFLITIIVTFSAAAYVLTLAGYCLYRYTIDKMKVVFPLMVIAGAIWGVTNLNAGDNIVNEIIIGKMTRETGAVDGRFSADTNRLWEKSLQDDSLIFGLGSGIKLKQSAGYKVFILMNGFVGAALVLLTYWLIQRIYFSALGLSLFILLLISFLQRVYCFWDAFLDPYILGTAVLSMQYETGEESYRYIPE